jgi:hypothetical protein
VNLSNLVVKIADLRCCLQSNRHKVPSILQFELGQLLLTRNFLTKTVSSVNFTISKARLEKVLRGRERGENSPSTSGEPDIRGQLDKIVQIAANLNLIGPSNLFISRSKFRCILQANADVAPSIDQYRLGEVLRTYGYLNPKARNPKDTFAFSEPKIRPMLSWRRETKEEVAKVGQQQTKLEDLFKTKHEELKKLLELMVADNILTSKQNVVHKHVVLGIFRANLKELPNLTFKGVSNWVKFEVINSRIFFFLARNGFRRLWVSATESRFKSVELYV